MSTESSAEGVISSLKATIESLRREVNTLRMQNAILRVGLDATGRALVREQLDTIVAERDEARRELASLNRSIVGYMLRDDDDRTYYQGGGVWDVHPEYGVVFADELTALAAKLEVDPEGACNISLDPIGMGYEKKRRLAFLESTAADARMCAEALINTRGRIAAGELSPHDERELAAARRILGQLPPRPVVDMDDVRTACEWMTRLEAEHEGAADDPKEILAVVRAQEAAARILAALGGKQ